MDPAQVHKGMALVKSFWTVWLPLVSGMAYGSPMDMDATRRSPLSAALAEQLRAERAAARMSQAELAKASGVSPAAIKRLELNQREMDTDQLDRLCRALDLSVVEFVTRAHTRQVGRPTVEATRREAR